MMFEEYKTAVPAPATLVAVRIIPIKMPFELFSVSDTTEVVVGSAGLKIVPNYSDLHGSIKAMAGKSDV